MKKRKLFRTIVISISLVLGAGIFASCGGGKASSDSIFTYSIGGDPGINCNAINSTGRWGLMTSNMIYSPLFKVIDGKIEWYLATGYELSSDNLTYTFTLREGVQWSDGEPFNADDVVFTIKAIENPNHASEMYSNFVMEDGKVEVKKIDDYKVSFTFPHESPANIQALEYQIYIMPEHIFGKVTDYDAYEFPGTSVGTGPYVLTEYKVGSYLKFEKNKTYFMNQNHGIDTIIFRIITNDDTALLALQSGEIDAWPATASALTQIDTKANNLTIYSYNQGRVGYMEINAVTVSDVRIRKAILYALNKKTLAVAGYGEYGDDVNTFLPPNNVYYDDSKVERYAQDINTGRSGRLEIDNWIYKF